MKKIAWYFSKYNKTSLWAFFSIVAVCASVAFYWRSIIGEGDLEDPLLWGIWAFMVAVLCWDIRTRRDLIRMLVGFIGGLVIEAWGTDTNLWSYYTDERPPLWILPAWPVATMAIDRISRVVSYFSGHIRIERLWWLIAIAFPLLMLQFVWPTITHWSTIFVFTGVVGVLAISKDRRQDVTLMIAGAGLGFFLEYWGTSRHCWTYYTHEIPPVFAVFAHGIASITFQRMAKILETIYAWMGDNRR